jgi:hypothetical protein
VETEPYYLRVDREAVERLVAELAKPMPVDRDDMHSETFDPWELFPALYGYSSDFDDLAIDVLVEINTKVKKRSDLAAEMFREMLCSAHLCDYGTSPRVCFATQGFMALLPELIEKWRTWRTVKWKAPASYYAAKAN